MLEHPVHPTLLAIKLVAVTMCSVRAISRKGSGHAVRESSETIRQTRFFRTVMIWPGLHGDVESPTEMIGPPTATSGVTENERS